MMDTDSASSNSSPRSLPPFPSVDIVDVPSEHFATRMVEAVDRAQGHRDCGSWWRSTANRIVDIVFAVDCGCGIAVSAKQNFAILQETQHVDFQSLDKNERWPTGYMTQRLQGIHVGDPLFLNAMQEFTAHTNTDRWPAGHHEAGNLPKDGFVLLDVNGYRIKCATRICGLPLPPLRWDGIGTRHMAALSLSWALQSSDFPSFVIVRSDSGIVHSVISSNGGATLLRCRPGHPMVLQPHRVIQVFHSSTQGEVFHISCVALTGQELCVVEVHEDSSIALMRDRIADELNTEKFDPVLADGRSLLSCCPSMKVRCLFHIPRPQPVPQPQA